MKHKNLLNLDNAQRYTFEERKGRKGEKQTV